MRKGNSYGLNPLVEAETVGGCFGAGTDGQINYSVFG